MRRFLPFLMAFIICFASAVPAFAGSVTTVDGTSLSTEYMVDNKTYDFVEHYEEYKSNYPDLQYIVIATGDQYLPYWLYRCNEGFYAVTNADGTVNIYAVDGTASDKFKWNNQYGKWTYYSSAGTYIYQLNDTYKLVWASDDILNEDGTVYFKGDVNFPVPPAPLAEQIQGVTEETLKTETVPALGGTMKVLVLCGVGLIASLVVLKLFGKRSLIFRS